VFKFRLKAVEGEEDLNAPIPDRPAPRRIIQTSVKLEVWKRDGCKCVKYGFSDDLHFDHDLPFSLTGTSDDFRFAAEDVKDPGGLDSQWQNGQDNLSTYLRDALRAEDVWHPAPDQTTEQRQQELADALNWIIDDLAFWDGDRLFAAVNLDVAGLSNDERVQLAAARRFQGAGPTRGAAPFPDARIPQAPCTAPAPVPPSIRWWAVR
jgi:hypothetical protein